MVEVDNALVHGVVIQSLLDAGFHIADGGLQILLAGKERADLNIQQVVDLGRGRNAPPHVGSVKGSSDRIHIGALDAVLLPEGLTRRHDAEVVVELALLLEAGIHLDPLPGQILVLGGGGDGNIPCAQQADAGLVMRRNGEGPLADDLRLCRIIAGLGQAEGRPGFADTGVAGQEVLNGFVNAPAQPVRVNEAFIIESLQIVQRRSGLFAVDGDIPVLIGPGTAHGPEDIVEHTAELAVDTGR